MRRSLAIVCALAFGLPALLVAVLAATWSEQLVLFGYKSHRLVGKLQQFESYLGSTEHAGARNETYTIAVFGDSTHFYTLPKERWMLPSLREALDERGIDDVAVYGFSFTALTAWDYYLLLNRIADEEVDLLVLPVNLRSFSTAWLTRPNWHFPTLHRYLRATELSNAWGLEVMGRRFEWEQMALQRLDIALFDGRAKPFFRGMRYLFGLGRAGFDESVAALGDLPPLDEAVAKDEKWLRLDTEVGPDHELFDVFDRINDLAASRGTRVLYYTGQINVTPFLRAGHDPELPRRFQRIFPRLRTGPHIDVLDLSAHNPTWLFSDRFHYSEPGIAWLAGELLDAAEIIRSRPASEQGQILIPLEPATRPVQNGL